MLNDPTLQAIDAHIETEENAIPQRNYLGGSSLSEPCSRKLWYGFRHAKTKDKKAKLVKAAIDGHMGEDLQTSRLRMVEGITLQTVDPSTGKQFEYSLFNGMLQSHMDGKIIGLLHSPTVWHVWEHKSCNQKKYDELTKCKEKHENGNALREWDIIYFGQAQLYMHLSGLHHHYLTVSLPGGRDTQSCVTSYDKAYADSLIKKAEKIIFSDSAPPRIHESPSWFYCKHFCDYYSICHERDIPATNCRTCLHSTPEESGSWSCAKHDIAIEENFEHVGCEKHLYLPDMLGSKAVDSDGTSVTYEDGRVNSEGGRVE